MTKPSKQQPKPPTPERLAFLNAGSVLARPEEAAFILGVSKSTIYDWARDRKIPCLREGEIVRFHMPTVMLKKMTKV